MTPIVTGLDHIVLVVPDLGAGEAAYASLLGRPADWRAQAEGGAASAIFRVANTSLELMAPAGEGPVADRLREIIAVDGPGLKTLAFGTADIETAHHRLTRRGLKPFEIMPGESTNEIDGKRREWRRFRCSDEETSGVKTFLIQSDAPLPVRPAEDGGVVALDLALDRNAPEWKTRFLFFRTGGLTFEVIHRLGETHDPAAADRIWGLTWTVEDLSAAHARLTDAGFNISEIRKGRKPGTRVFTVREGTMNVPTLFIAHTPK